MNATSASDSAVTAEKLLARAKKFGTPVDENVKKEMRAQRFGLQSTSAADSPLADVLSAEKLAARAARFGIVTPTTLVSI